MAVTRKPKPQDSSAEADVMALIEKGGSVATNKPKRTRTKPQLVQLRLSREVVDRIDSVIQSRLVPPSRHTWLLEAVYEKLQREEETSER